MFHVLQLAARSREKGMSAVELGPAVGTGQGSLHYFMKVLTDRGLWYVVAQLRPLPLKLTSSLKVPVSMHASITNLLVFHRFVHLNPHYQAHIRYSAKEPDDSLDADRDKDLPKAEDSEDDEADDGEDLSGLPTFPRLHEAELMAGLVPRDRLVELLKSPVLKNHLLKARNLLYHLVSPWIATVPSLSSRDGKAYRNFAIDGPYASWSIR